MGTSFAIHRKTGQRRVVSAYEILFLFFSNGIFRSDVMNDIFQSLTTCTLIIKQVLLKYSDSYICNWHWKFANCLTLPKVDVLSYDSLFIYPQHTVCSTRINQTSHLDITKYNWEKSLYELGLLKVGVICENHCPTPATRLRGPHAGKLRHCSRQNHIWKR